MQMIIREGDTMQRRESALAGGCAKFGAKFLPCRSGWRMEKSIRGTVQPL